jgi:hypothetical protein
MPLAQKEHEEKYGLPPNPARLTDTDTDNGAKQDGDDGVSPANNDDSTNHEDVHSDSLLDTMIPGATSTISLNKNLPEDAPIEDAINSNQNLQKDTAVDDAVNSGGHESGHDIGAEGGMSNLQSHVSKILTLAIWQR